MDDMSARLVEQIEDSIRERLEADGIEARRSWLFDRPSLGISNGSAFEVGGGEIVYRLTDPETVLIVLYRRKKAARRSLSNSFAGISWFVEFLKSQVPAVRFLVTLVNTRAYADDEGISSERLTEFCTRCNGELRAVDGKRWIHLEIARFAPLRSVARAVDRPRQTPPPAFATARERR